MWDSHTLTNQSLPVIEFTVIKGVAS